jgi:hypothetical protein
MSIQDKVYRLRRFISENPSLASIPIAVVGGKPITVRDALSMLERGENVQQVTASLAKESNKWN